MVIGIQNEILDGHHRFLFKRLTDFFSNGSFEKSLQLSPEDFVLYF